MKKVDQEQENQIARIGNWANGFHILLIIGRIFLYITALTLLILLFFIPKIADNIHIEDNKITIFKEVIEYKIYDTDIMYFKHGKEETKINFKKIATPIVKALKNLDKGVLRNILLISISVAIIGIILMIIILKKLDKLLVRIKEENKVFVENGNKEIITIMWLMVASIIIGVFGELIINIISKADSIRINFDIKTIIYVLFIYFISLIYKYGESLEK